MINVGENTIIDADNRISFFYKKITDEPILNIWFPGAYNRRKGVVQYQRHTWIHSFEGSFLIFDDPTITLDNDLNIGWFQGHDGELIEVVKKIIEQATVLLGFEERNIRIFGSSAGGFVSLKLSEYFKKADVLVINPQVYLLNYSKPHIERLLNYSYKKDINELGDMDTVKLSYSYSPDREGNIFYFQNNHDTVHVNKHLNRLLEECEELKLNFTVSHYPEPINFNGSSNFFVILYNDSISKHNPPNIQGTMSFFNYVY